VKLDPVKRVVREDLADAPKGEWLDTLLTTQNQQSESVIQALRGNLTVVDNMTDWFHEAKFTHGVEERIAIPKGKPSPTGVSSVMVKKLTSAASTDALPVVQSVSMRYLNGTSATDTEQVGVTVYYDLRHTEPRLRVTKNAAQSLANNTNESLTWQTLIRQFPVPATPGISNGIIYVDSGTASRIRVTEAGQYLVSASVYFATSAVGVRDLWFEKNGSAAERWGTTQIINAGAVETGITATDQVPMVPGDYLTILAFQNSGGALNALSTGFPTSVAINRLYNDSTPTANVTLRFHGR